MENPELDTKAKLIKETMEAPLGKIQSELIWRFLTRHIVPKPDREKDILDVLDIGAGVGETSIRLAEGGHRVTMLEPSMCLLETVEERVREEIPEREPNLTFLNQRIEDLEECDIEKYDLILCHETIEFVDDPLRAFNIISRAIKPRGMLSLVFLNRYGDVFHQALVEGNTVEAMQSIEKERFKTEMHKGWGRLYSPEEMENLLEPLGYSVEGDYGIRVFSDYLDCSIFEDGDCLRGMLELEERVGAVIPFRYVGRYMHYICRKD